jgi:c(7)-type cytochrome triheme protein
MRSRCIVLVAVFCLIAGSASFATGDGKVLLYGGAGQGRVVFDGRVHAANGFTCNDCHLQLFATHKRALITMDDHSSNRSCFACHNGEKAFNDCDKCHRSFDNAPVKVRQEALQSLTRAVATAPAHEPLTYEGATTDLENLTHDQVMGIFNGTVTNWKQLGGPDRAIVVYS